MRDRVSEKSRDIIIIISNICNKGNTKACRNKKERKRERERER